MEIPEICYWLDNEKRILIGSYPYDEYTFHEIVSIGIDVFVNLMPEPETKRTVQYSIRDKVNNSNLKYISIPIMDKYILEDDDRLLNYVDKLMSRVTKMDQKIYVFCNNGHGRSGVIAAMLLHRLHPDWDYKTVLANLQHQHRYMKHQGRSATPQTTPQYNQIHRILTNQSDIFFHDPKDIHYYLSNSFTNNNGIPLFIDENGEKWYSVEAYYQAHKFMHSKRGCEYAKWIQKADTPHKAYLLGQKYICRMMPAHNICVSKKEQVSIRYLMCEYMKIREADCIQNWEEIREDVMHKALTFKFTQDPFLKRKLIRTGCSILRHYVKDDPYWGEFWKNGGSNRLGKILMEIRNKLNES